MKAIILDGSHTDQPDMDKLSILLDGQLKAAGWAVERILLRDERVAFCLGCFECWTKSPGLCRIDDAGRDVASEVINSDLAVFLTPVTFGGYSSQLKKVVDRLISLISPFFKKIEGEVHHQARYDHYPALLAVGLLSAADAAQERIFHELVRRNGLNLHATHSASHVVIGGAADEKLPAIIESILQKAEVSA